MLSMEERFWSRVRKTSGCWWWIGAHYVMRKGEGDYGAFRPSGRKNGKRVLAHRMAYELVVGPIPEGLVLDHLCRNRLCVRPDHLEPVTLQVNILRGVGRGAQNARKTRCLNGHEFDEVTKRGVRECGVCRRKRNRVATARWKAKQR